MTPSPTHPSGRRLSLAHLTVIDAGPVELIRAAAAGGFDHVGLRIVAPTASDRIVPVIGDETMIRAILDAMAATGVSILDVEAIWLTPDTDPAAFTAIAETAARLGATQVLAIGHDPEPSRQVENFGRLAATARQHGLGTMLEFIPYCVVNTLAAAEAVVDAAVVAGSGIMIDALHLRRSGGGPQDLAGISPDRLSYIQLCDARREPPFPDDLRREARGDRLYPGDGELDIAGLLDALPAGIPLSIEAPVAGHAGLSAMERARLCGERTRATLEALGQR
ncbi:sugar phosphate isomerase/epimerase family protein [Phreatobacter stygius]|uniref:Sugar phosphate isomerase/epimerase n=1 Tax=Phreatobacter stygius TaxID=1940610 RepID=A0A4D7BBA5_9HYPH|nr:sugar phosphate isomerase/epimerase [Phreatobacter stygius]QCI65357.1 sugar phosphate isomerase/epimerase [Phreatobacter stygius]